MRIAFLTPEFVTDYKDGGGLGNYLHRMSKLLIELGHQPEIFVSSQFEPRVVSQAGIRVERVPTPTKGLGPGLLRHMRWMTKVGNDLGTVLSGLSRSFALAKAMERRHSEAPFDLVQSADLFAAGFAVRKSKNRVHLVRCSSAADLYNDIDGYHDRIARWREVLERRTIQRADRAYAPSWFVAKHFQRSFGIPVEVLRPPVKLEVPTSTERPSGLPERYFVHFGQLTRRKGTLWLGEALKQVFEIEPSVHMVWVGRGNFDELRAIYSGLGQYRSNIQIRYPLPKPDIYNLIQHADAAVLPSLVDNLPNTVIESLMLGIPVIGTRGASIDELVEHGVTGELVTPGNVRELAEVIVKMWRGQSTVRKGFRWSGGVADEMRPEIAIRGLLQLAGMAV